MTRRRPNRRSKRSGARSPGIGLRALKLVEEGGNPDVFLNQAESAHGDTLTALQAGDPEAAAAEARRGRSAAEQAQATIDKVQKARAFCERELPARPRETERLRTAMTQAEAVSNDLERDFARSSWQAVARNLDQARSLLATFDRQAEQAAAAATTTRQEYLQGAAHVEELARQQQIVLRLMSGLGEQLNALVSVRNECRTAQRRPGGARAAGRALDPPERGDRQRRGAEQPGVGTAGQGGDHRSLRRSRPPTGPRCGRALKEVIEDLSIAQSQAEEDIKYHEALTQEFEQVRSTAGRVYAFSRAVIRKTAWRPTSITRRPPMRSTGSRWRWPSRAADRPRCSSRCAGPRPT